MGSRRSSYCNLICSGVIIGLLPLQIDTFEGMNFMRPLFGFLLFFISFQSLKAQKDRTSINSSRSLITNSIKKESDFKFLPIPYINFNRSLGFSLGAVPIAMYTLNKSDTISPSSTSGGIGFYTTSDSWFAVQFNTWYLNEDRYRIKLSGGLGNINFQFYLEHPISPGYIDYNTTAEFFTMEVQRKLHKKLYLGAHYSYSKVSTDFDINNQPTQVDFFQSIGLVSSIDTRDNVYYPYKGFLSEINYTSFPEFLDNPYISQKFEIDYNPFFQSENDQNIWANRLYVGFGIGDLGFSQQFVVGRTDIRGYTLGKYRGNQIIAIQSEYRFNPYKKLGFVGFAGVATVFGAINDSDNGLLLPGMGLGVRYVVFEENHMNMGMDIAVGKGDWGLYFKIGESF
ncbi:MAG: outer membrane protein assembly factor BamA [Salibacteraceae bacterium]|jgi:outer membrane protein assembly factor BamA